MKSLSQLTEHLSQLRKLKRRPTSKVLEVIESQIEADLLKLPSIPLMHILAQQSFLSKKLFDKLKKTWITQASTNFSSVDFARGFASLAKTSFLEHSELNWSIDMLKLNMDQFSPSSLILVLRGIVLLDMNDEALIERAVNAIVSRGISRLNVGQKAVLYSAFVGLEIDRPHFVPKLLAPLTAIRSELESSQRLISSVKSSAAEGVVANALTNLGYKFRRHVPLAGLYEIDFLVQSHRLAVEMLGIPYHTTLYGNFLSSSTKLKTRHLKRSGLNVVNIFETDDLEYNLKRAIHSVGASISPLTAQISGDYQFS